MYCKRCGASISANERYCGKCGALNVETNEMTSKNDSRKTVQQGHSPQYNTSAPQGQPLPNGAPVPQGQPLQKNTPVPLKHKKKKNKKKPSGCLITFLIFLAIGLVLGVGGIFLLGKILPGGSNGVSGNQQVQPPYSEPVASTPLRESLGGTYIPDEKDFRFDDSDSVSGYVDHVILVFFQADVTDDEVRRVAALVNGELIGCIDTLNCFELRVPASGKAALDELCETLLREESVIRACTDSVDRAASLDWSDPYLGNVVPNDPWDEPTWLPQQIRNVLFQQWSMLFPRGKNWHQELIGAPSAWAYSDYYSPISVGIMDGGFDTGHSDLWITVENPEINDEKLNNIANASDYNHGTHVAGIIGATRGNGNGINGILSGPYSLYGYCVDFGVKSWKLDGTKMLLNKGCKVINISIGSDWAKVKDSAGKTHNAINENNRPFDIDTGLEYSDTEWFNDGVAAAKDMLTLLDIYGKDFIIVNSAGNNGIDARYNGWVCAITRDCAERAVEETPTTIYTADDIMNAIVIVGAVANNENYGSFSLSDSGEVICDQHLELAFFSNYGDQVTICAPGDDIYSTVRNGYASKPGTSMAAPIVTACATQIWSVDPDQTAGEVKEKLVYTASNSVETVSSFDTAGRTYLLVNLKDAIETALSEEGLITETRPDGDLKEIIDKCVYENIEKREPELQILVGRFANEFANGDVYAVFNTSFEMMKIWLSMVFYSFLYLIAVIVFP